MLTRPNDIAVHQPAFGQSLFWSRKPLLHCSFIYVILFISETYEFNSNVLNDALYIRTVKITNIFWIRHVTNLPINSIDPVKCWWFSPCLKGEWSSTNTKTNLNVLSIVQLFFVLWAYHAPSRNGFIIDWRVAIITIQKTNYIKLSSCNNIHALLFPLCINLHFTFKFIPLPIIYFSLANLCHISINFYCFIFSSLGSDKNDAFYSLYFNCCHHPTAVSLMMIFFLISSSSVNSSSFF